MGLVVWAAGVKAAAVDLEINYHRPVPLHQSLTLEARIIARDDTKTFSTGEIRLADGTVAVSGRGIYVSAPQLFEVLSWNAKGIRADPGAKPSRRYYETAYYRHACDRHPVRTSCSPSSGSPDGPVTSGTPQPSLNPATDPRPGDDDLVRAPAYVKFDRSSRHGELSSAIQPEYKRQPADTLQSTEGQGGPAEALGGISSSRSIRLRTPIAFVRRCWPPLMSTLPWAAIRPANTSCY